uniref:Reverse transcriptase domain-containing protein n=1 Tax=Tanacetum cinerariifolium TaxID=118510 RepID=A0A6L2KH78_TANCI|nr:hypothetical protein [Tanacetum cinerariifolium]
MPVTRQGENDAITSESIQAMIDQAIQRNSTHTPDDGIQNSGGGPRRPVQPSRVCSYTNFMKCQPLNFKGTEGVVGLSQWLKKMESLFHISGCAVDNQVKFVACTLLGTLKKKLMDKYCPKGEIKKLEIEFWNLKVDKYIGGLPDNIHENVMSARPKTLHEGHYKSDCPELKNQKHGNQAEGTGARGMVYALGGEETNQDLDEIKDDINA